MKQFFFLKLVPLRSGFFQDMNSHEREIMQRHVEYWTDWMERGTMHAFGPVFDPDGTYGVGVVGVDSRETLDSLLASDPASGLHRCVVLPMKAIVPR